MGCSLLIVIIKRLHYKILLERGVEYGDAILVKLFTLRFEIVLKTQLGSKDLNMDGNYLNKLCFINDYELITNNSELEVCSRYLLTLIGN